MTFTANEFGWRDQHTACGGRHFGERPVEATRHYNHRWRLFNKTYLTGDTPLGFIERKWYRHEDQVITTPTPSLSESNNG